jgi:hypothetical protein
MDNLKLVLTAVLFGIVAIGGMVYFEVSVHSKAFFPQH